MPIVKITEGERRRPQTGPSTGNVQSALQTIAKGADPLHAARDMALVLLAAQRGLRRAEIAALTVADVDLDARTIRVVRKGHSERVGIRIEGAAYEALAQWMTLRSEIADPDRGAVFVGVGNRSRGRGMTPAAIYEAIRRAGARVTGDVWSPHRLRHSAITDTYRQTGGNILATQQAAGHASQSTTAGYIDNKDEIEQQAVAATARTYTLPKMAGAKQ